MLEHSLITHHSSPTAPRPSFIAIADGDALLTVHCPPPTADDTQVCGFCHQSLEMNAFGIVRQRKSGRNPYCKACMRTRVADSRAKRRGQARAKRASQQPLPLIGEAPHRQPGRDANGLLVCDEIKNPKQPHHERVLSAIHQGARTQREIYNALGYRSHVMVAAQDEIGESLALLMLGTPKLIKTSIVDGRRVFVPAATIARKESATAPYSFSTLGGMVHPISHPVSTKGKAAA
jgi:hypothetical protein